MDIKSWRFLISLNAYYYSTKVSKQFQETLIAAIMARSMNQMGWGVENQTTSPWVLGIIVALAIFFSTNSRAPVLSSEALTKVPEL